MLSSSRRNDGAKHGFTLVELLVVIAIIAVLISILIPALSAVRGHAKSAVCTSNLRQLGECMSMYIQDNNGYFCPKLGGSVMTWVGKAGSLSGYNSYGANVRYLDHYINPSYTASSDVPLAHCPSDLDLVGYYDLYGSSYGSNHTLPTPAYPAWPPSLLAPSIDPNSVVPISIGMVHHPSQFIVAADHAGDAYAWNNSLTTAVYYTHSPKGDPQWNVLFADGHVSCPTFKLGILKTADYDYANE